MPQRLLLAAGGALLTAVLALSAGAAEGPDALAHGAVSAWLAAHPGYRLATDADCGCADDIADIRAGESWGGANFRPYVAVGDFNRDGVRDLAVGVISQAEPTKLRVLIINGQRPAARAFLPYLSEPFALQGTMLYPLVEKKGHARLLVGAYATEAPSFEPTKSGYKLVEPEEEG